MFSQTVEYALRAVVCLAQAEQCQMTTLQIADCTHVPVGYLSKVLQSLSRGGLIKATRGLGGGYALAVASSDLSVLQVINTIEPVQRIKHCPLGLEAHDKRLCQLHRKLDRVLADMEDSLRKTTIAELIGKSSRNSALCELPAAKSKRR